MKTLKLVGLFFLITITCMWLSAPHKSTVQASTPQPHQSSQGTSIYAPPSLTAQQVDTILTYYHSPAAGTGSRFYADSLTYGIDDALPLAFFFNESTMGTAGMAKVTYAIGNERCIPDRSCVNTAGTTCQIGQSCYAQMLNWSDGIDHWYELIAGPVYKGAGLTTLETILPKYAPSDDGNAPTHYIATVEMCVHVWHSGSVEV